MYVEVTDTTAIVITKTVINKSLQVWVLLMNQLHQTEDDVIGIVFENNLKQRPFPLKKKSVCVGNKEEERF